MYSYKVSTRSDFKGNRHQKGFFSNIKITESDLQCHVFGRDSAPDRYFSAPLKMESAPDKKKS